MARRCDCLELIEAISGPMLEVRSFLHELDETVGMVLPSRKALLENITSIEWACKEIDRYYATRELTTED